MINMSVTNQSKIFAKLLTTMSLALLSLSTFAGGKDDPLLSMIQIKQLEFSQSDGQDNYSFDGQAWFGYDLDKVWIKSTFEKSGNTTEAAELQLLYGKAIAPFWDFQVGIRRDFQPTPSQNWAVIGVQGLAPYFFEIDTAFYLGKNGETAFRFEAEYEMLFTQKWILTPEIEANFYGQNDQKLGMGSGLSDIELGLRLRYEFSRKFSIYTGINSNKLFGNSADFARLEGKPSSSTEWVVGIRAWF